MAQCPGCNKFPTYSTDTEPETDSLEASDVVFEKGDKEKVKGIVQVTGDIRIVLTSECCGEEMKESNFSVDAHIEVAKAKDCTCKKWGEDVELEAENATITDRSESFKVKIAKRGPNKGQEVRVPIASRYQKRFYGVEVELHVKCACGKQIGTDNFSDEVQASGMDELN